MANDRAKIIGAILLVLIPTGYGFYRARSVSPGAAANNGVSDEFSPRDRQNFQSQRDEMIKKVGLTKEQEKKIEQVRAEAQKNHDWGALRTVFQDILTTPQRDIARQQMQQARDKMQAARAARDAKAKNMLGEAQFERYQQKRQERRGGFGGPFGRGGGRGGPGSGGPSVSAPAGR